MRNEFAYKQKYSIAIEDAEEILSGINFSAHSCIDMSWEFEVKEQVGLYFIRTSFKRKDIVTGEFGVGWGRWHTTPVELASETSIIMTAWVAVKMIVEHELLESFEYHTKNVFNPHKTIKELIYPDTL
jgi:hypothetical protein